MIADLHAAGLPVEREWFAPHFEFRFPRSAQVERCRRRLEVRQALEPWLVLGEEGDAGGTARYVDSSWSACRCSCARRQRSLRRDLQRYTLPLTATGAFGGSVAGVRYPGLAAGPGFHPTIPPHVPLTFDIVDTWNGRSIGGCRYHAAHPGGRNFDLAPVNAFEAEGRRLARFESSATRRAARRRPRRRPPRISPNPRPAALTRLGRHGHRQIYSFPGLAAVGATQREALSSRHIEPPSRLTTRNLRATAA